jgi:hypothetical protein
MISFIYILILIAWLFLFVGFYFKEFTITALGSTLMIVLGVYTAINGLDGFFNIATQALSVTHMCIGAYILIRGSYELYKDT